MSMSESVLSQSLLFQNLEPGERTAVLRLMELEGFAPGEEILTEGHQNQILWVILSGRCEVVKRVDQNKQHRLAELEAGAVFGEVSFFESGGHSASVRALTDVETLKLPRERFDDLQGEHPGAAYRIASNTAAVLARRLRQMDEWTCELVDKPEAKQHRDEWQNFRAKLYTGWEF